MHLPRQRCHISGVCSQRYTSVPRRLVPESLAKIDGFPAHLAIAFPCSVFFLFLLYNWCRCLTPLNRSQHALTCTMSDPLSTAASVAGLVSLGLQVYSGVSTYLDAVQGRDDDLESARQNAKNLEETLRFIEQSIPRLQANHQIHVVTISKCVQSCRIQLTSLQDLLHKLGASPNLSGSFRDDVRDRKKKLAYPFHRSNLDRLESQLGKVYGTLQTALQVLEMYGLHLVFAKFACSSAAS